MDYRTVVILIGASNANQQILAVGRICSIIEGFCIDPLNAGHGTVFDALDNFIEQYHAEHGDDATAHLVSNIAKLRYLRPHVLDSPTAEGLVRVLKGYASLPGATRLASELKKIEARIVELDRQPHRMERGHTDLTGPAGPADPADPNAMVGPARGTLEVYYACDDAGDDRAIVAAANRVAEQVLSKPSERLNPLIDLDIATMAEALLSA